MMHIAQVAAAAIRQGGSGQPETWIGLGILGVSSVAMWLRIIFVEGRKAKAESEKLAGYPEGSVGTILWDHSKQLTIHNVEIKNIFERLAEVRNDNRLDHAAIFSKIDTLKDQIFDKLDDLRVGK